MQVVVPVAANTAGKNHVAELDIANIVKPSCFVFLERKNTKNSPKKLMFSPLDRLVRVHQSQPLPRLWRPQRNLDDLLLLKHTDRLELNQFRRQRRQRRNQIVRADAIQVRFDIGEIVRQMGRAYPAGSQAVARQGSLERMASRPMGIQQILPFLL